MVEYFDCEFEVSRLKGNAAYAELWDELDVFCDEFARPFLECGLSPGEQKVKILSKI